MSKSEQEQSCTCTQDLANLLPILIQFTTRLENIETQMNDMETQLISLLQRLYRKKHQLTIENKKQIKKVDYLIWKLQNVERGCNWTDESLSAYYQRRKNDVTQLIRDVKNWMKKVVKFSKERKETMKVVARYKICSQLPDSTMSICPVWNVKNKGKGNLPLHPMTVRGQQVPTLLRQKSWDPFLPNIKIKKELALMRKLKDWKGNEEALLRSSLFCSSCKNSTYQSEKIKAMAVEKFEKL
ncbi:uncharacterized protein LOC124722436 [Schistocerca piceifrons]|uniref:uncharacterized protein LOC124722436 n=1 Tax=Schistocerca piceifrons TaxID=274613 RepID=UPI001F5F4FC9|nr:uncharacterized protein LOC124722436 [Schistocerca piceifrons]